MNNKGKSSLSQAFLEESYSVMDPCDAFEKRWEWLDRALEVKGAFPDFLFQAYGA